MTLVKRTILIIVSTFIALFFILAVSSDVILLNSFAALERVVVADNIQKVRNEIEESYDELLASADEFIELLSIQGNSFAKVFPPSTLQSRHVDVVICFSSKNEALFSIVGDNQDKPVLVTGSNMVAVQLAKMIPDAKEISGDQVSGLVLVGNKAMQVIVSPLKERNMLLLVGRYLDENEIDRITALTEFSIKFLPVDSSHNQTEITSALSSIAKGDKTPVQVVDSDTVCGYALLTDLYDQPALFVKITEKRVLYKQGKASIIYVLAALVVCGSVFCGVMLFFIRGVILNRLASLTKKVAHVSTQGDISARLPVSSHEDELKDLAVSINGMLDSLERSEEHLRESEERYRMLFEMAPDAIIILGMEGDEAGRVVAANQVAADQHGYTLAEIMSLSIYDLNTAETNKIAGDIFKSVAAGEWVNLELWHRRKDGTQFPVEVHAGQIKIGGKMYILGFDREITERKITEETNLDASAAD